MLNDCSYSILGERLVLLLHTKNEVERRKAWPQHNPWVILRFAWNNRDGRNRCELKSFIVVSKEKRAKNSLQLTPKCWPIIWLDWALAESTYLLQHNRPSINCASHSTPGTGRQDQGQDVRLEANRSSLKGWKKSDRTFWVSTETKLMFLHLNTQLGNVRNFLWLGYNISLKEC